MSEFNVNPYTQNGSRSKQEATFSDIPISFDFHPGTKDLARVLDEDAVRNSLRNILKTSRYERVFNPFFGANLNRMLFEQLDARNMDNVDTLIRTAIESYEPRVDVLDVIVTGYTDENTLAITLLFSILNNPTEQRLDLTIVRVR